MPRYRVTVRYEMERELTCYGRDEGEAMEKAEEIVSGWNDVVNAEATDAEED